MGHRFDECVRSFEVVLRLLLTPFYGNSHAYLYPWHMQERSVLGCTQSAHQANGAYDVHISLACARSALYLKYRTKIFPRVVNCESY
jgi:hypothetical protein